MSSIEIVKLINDHRSNSIVDAIIPTLRHSDFLAKVPNVLGVEYSEKFRSTYLANNGKENPCYRFEKREACLMAMSYSYELQAIVFDRMTELENQAIKPKELSRMDLIQIALAAEQENIELRNHVAVIEPKAKGLDRIASCDGNLGIREAAKVLKVNQKTLVQYLMDHKVIYRDQSKKLQGYQKSVDQKLIHISVSGPRQTESGEKVFSQVKLTQKLITRIASWLEKTRA